MKKPINQATMASLVSYIRSNLEAFSRGDRNSGYYAERVMGLLTGLMMGGHVIDVSIWPQGNVTQVWEVRIDSIKLCMGGVLYDETAVPKLLKRERG